MTPKESQEKLAYLSGVVESAMDAIISMDETQCITLFNPAAERMFGYLAAEMVGQSIERLMPERFRASHGADVRTYGETGETSRRMGALGNIQGIRKDGTEFPIEASISKTAVGGRRIFTVVLRDITERMRATKADARLAAIVESSSDAIIGKDLTGQITNWNTGAEKIFGYSEKEMVGTSIMRLIPADRQAEELHILGKIKNGESVKPLETLRKTKDGKLIDVSITVSPIRDAAGKIIGVSKTARDISDRKGAEEALRESNERFQQIAASIHEVYWITSPDLSQMIYISPSYENIWGRKCQELYDSPQDWMLSIQKEDRPKVESALSKIADGLDVEYRIVQPGGAVRWIRARGAPVRDAEGRIFRIAGVAEDITERRQLESQLHLAQKMEALGQLAGGVAHDFNNILTIITGYSQLLLMKLPANDPMRKIITSINHAGGRASSLTRQMLAFSRQTVLEPQVIDLNTTIKETEKLLHRLIGEDIALTTVPGPNLKRVKIDPSQLDQVLMNLAINARDAMPRGGQITIETSNAELDETYAKSRTEVHPGQYVLISVSDTGCGMSPEIQARIFEPFFTTKPVGKGTGLGLAVVHGIVKQSGGHIAVYSEPDIGSSFKVYLPAMEEKASAVDAPVPAAPSGTETVLLVEDDDTVREFATLILQDGGYNIVSARNGLHALKLIEKSPKQIDLLATDVVMPEMNGRELAEALQKQFPKLKVLFVSGYTNDAVVRHGILHSEVSFLQKPYTPTSLLTKIRQVLDQVKR